MYPCSLGARGVCNPANSPSVLQPLMLPPRLSHPAWERCSYFNRRAAPNATAIGAIPPYVFQLERDIPAHPRATDTATRGGPALNGLATTASDIPQRFQQNSSSSSSDVRSSLLAPQAPCRATEALQQSLTYQRLRPGRRLRGPGQVSNGVQLHLGSFLDRSLHPQLVGVQGHCHGQDVVEAKPLPLVLV
jgi:hypothetical protein